MENFFNSYRLLDIEPVTSTRDTNVCSVSVKSGYLYFPGSLGKELDGYKKMNIMVNDITGDVAFVFVKDESLKGFYLKEKGPNVSSKKVSSKVLSIAVAKLFLQEKDFKLKLGENQSRNPNVIFRSAKLA